MTVLATAVDTEFTPTKGIFAAQVTDGDVILERKQGGSSVWAYGGQILRNHAVDVTNSEIGAVWRAKTTSGTPVFRATES